MNEDNVEAVVYAEDSYSTADESAEDNHYRPSPVVSEGGFEEVQQRSGRKT